MSTTQTRQEYRVVIDGETRRVITADGSTEEVCRAKAQDLADRLYSDRQFRLCGPGEHILYHCDPFSGAK